MTTGNVDNFDRPRMVPRQRLDAVDEEALAKLALIFNDYVNRAILSQPNATTASSVGEIWTGGSLTPNPTGPTDGKIKINSELFVGLDSNGRVLVKKSGTEITVSVPNGQSQFYVYWLETATDTQTRRFISVLPPFTESPQATDVANESGLTPYFRSGDVTTVVPEAKISVNNPKQPLLLLAIVTNTGGAVSVDLTDVTTRLCTVTAPAAFPSNNTQNGSMRTVTDMLRAALYVTGKLKWLSTTHFMADAFHNFGAYEDPPAGLDYTFRKTSDWLTIGSGTSLSKGDFDSSDYVSGDLCLAAALTALPATGGTIFLKQDVVLTLANDVTIPNGKDVTIIGSKTSVVQLDMGGYKLKFAAVGNKLTLTNLSIQSFGSTFLQLRDTQLIAERCRFSSSAGSTSPMITCIGSTVNNVTFRYCDFVGQGSMDSASAYCFIDWGLPVSNTEFSFCTFTLTTKTLNHVRISEMRQNVRFANCDFVFASNITPTATGSALVLSSSDNAGDGAVTGRVIANCSFTGSPSAALPAMHGIFATTLSFLKVSGSNFLRCTNGIYVQNPSGTGFWDISDTDFLNGSVVFVEGNAHTWQGTKFTNCNFLTSRISITNGIAKDLLFTGCTVQESYTGTAAVSVNVADSVQNLVFHRCSLYQSVDTTLAGIIQVITPSGTTNGIKGLRVTECDFSGTGSTITDNAILGVKVATNKYYDIDFSNNTFRDMQNVAYGGTANDSSQGSFRVVEIRAYAGVGLLFSNNKWINIAENLTVSGGGVRAMGRMICFKPHVDGSATGVWSGVLIDGNIFGGDDALATPWVVDGGAKVAAGDWSFTNNKCRYLYKTGVTFPYIADIYLSLADNAVSAIIFTGNFIRGVNTTGVILDRHAVQVGETGVTILAELTKLVFRNNDFDMSLNFFGFNTASGRGIRNASFTTVNSLVFMENTALAGADKFRTTGVGGATGSIPADPGAGNPWTFNTGIIRS